MIYVTYNMDFWLVLQGSDRYLSHLRLQIILTNFSFTYQLPSLALWTCSLCPI